MAAIVTADEYLAELRRLYARHNEIRFSMSTPHVMILVGVLQLALRHPAIPELSGDAAKAFIDSVKAKLSEYPAMCRVIEQGYEAAFDSPAERIRAIPIEKLQHAYGLFDQIAHAYNRAELYRQSRNLREVGDALNEADQYGTRLQAEFWNAWLTEEEQDAAEAAFNPGR